MVILKSCPFCGSKAKLYKEKANAAGTRFVYWISCSSEGEFICNCISKTCEFEKEIDAINAWNNRFLDNVNE